MNRSLDCRTRSRPPFQTARSRPNTRISTTDSLISAPKLKFTTSFLGRRCPSTSWLSFWNARCSRKNRGRKSCTRKKWLNSKDESTSWNCWGYPAATTQAPKKEPIPFDTTPTILWDSSNWIGRDRLGAKKMTSLVNRWEEEPGWISMAVISQNTCTWRRN